MVTPGPFVPGSPRAMGLGYDPENRDNYTSVDSKYELTGFNYEIINEQISLYSCHTKMSNSAIHQVHTRKTKLQHHVQESLRQNASGVTSKGTCKTHCITPLPGMCLRVSIT